MDQQREAIFFGMYCPDCQSYLRSPKWHHSFKLEKTLEDHDIPSRKWLQALQASLDGSLVNVYWDTFRQEERDMNEISKCTLMKWCVFPITECIQKVGVVRMKYLETIQEAF